MKTIEENVRNMYEARQLLLGLPHEEMPTANQRNGGFSPSAVQGGDFI